LHWYPPFRSHIARLSRSCMLFCIDSGFYSQVQLPGLEPYWAEMFLTRLWSIVVTFCSDRLSNMVARGHNSLWLAEIFKDLLIRYYRRMELKIVMNDHCKLLTKCRVALEKKFVLHIHRCQPIFGAISNKKLRCQ
jgi:hypothetical protein